MSSSNQTTKVPVPAKSKAATSSSSPRAQQQPQRTASPRSPSTHQNNKNKSNSNSNINNRTSPSPPKHYVPLDRIKPLDPVVEARLYKPPKEVHYEEKVWSKDNVKPLPKQFYRLAVPFKKSACNDKQRAQEQEKRPQGYVHKHPLSEEDVRLSVQHLHDQDTKRWVKNREDLDLKYFGVPRDELLRPEKFDPSVSPPRKFPPANEEWVLRMHDRTVEKARVNLRNIVEECNADNSKKTCDKYMKRLKKGDMEEMFARLAGK